jgi:uncharacterized membrane protein (DUF2068 family)
MRQRARLVVVIGCLRLLKAASLLVGGLWLLFDGEPAWLHRLLPDHTAGHLAEAALAYAAVFTVEGVGLVLRKRWAEWITVIVTASFMPIEAWEIVLRPDLLRIATILANALIVAYLLWRRLQERFHPGMVRVS